MKKDALKTPWNDKHVTQAVSRRIHVYNIALFICIEQLRNYRSL